MGGMTRPTPRRLDPDELSRQLEDLPDVRHEAGQGLVLSVRAPSFAEAIRLVQLVADDAEQLDHHPDIDIRWRTVRFALTTHSAGGVTQLDIELAHLVVRAAEQVGAEPVPPRSNDT